MKLYLLLLHLEAGRISGKDKTCGNKIKYTNEEKAQDAADSMNKSKKSDHELEPYPCVFCNNWHIGGIMSEHIMTNMVAGYWNL